MFAATIATTCAAGGDEVQIDVARIGSSGSAPEVTAEIRIVPGIAGIWVDTRAQAMIKDDILTQERAAAPECSSTTVVNTAMAAPDVFVRPKKGAPRLHTLQTWIVDRCGATVPYAVELIQFAEGVSFIAMPPSLLFSDVATDPVHAALKDLSAQRELDRASGAWADLNLPMPAKWRLAWQRPLPDVEGVIYEFLPEGQKLKNWQSMITVQVLAGDERPTPVELAEGARGLRKDLCGSEQEPIVTYPGGDFSPLPSARWLLICEKVPKQKYAEVTLGKALAGRSHLYYVHFGWRTKAGDRASILKRLEDEIAAAEAVLADVRLCNPVADPAGCQNPFFL